MTTLMKSPALLVKQMELHDYQKYAVEFIETHPEAAILLDMGLGKTIITLTAVNNLLFDYFCISKVLVIAPLRVAKNTWPAEIQKWNLNLKYSVVTGSETERREALKKKADIYIINRENVQWLIEKSGYKFDFDMLIVDELSSFKNHQSKRFKSLMKVRPLLDRVVGLTGTPSSNGLMDLYAEFRVIDMGQRLGRYIGRYRDEYFIPDKRNRERIFTYKPRPGAEERIYKKISDITISMKSTEYLKMPKLVSTRYTVFLSAQEREKYNKLRDDLVLTLPDGEITASNAATLTGKLVQMANGAVYNENGEITGIHDRKLDALEDIIESMNGNPLLIAYWYKHDLERIKKRLNAPYLLLDNEDSIRKWNSGRYPLALIHPASAGHGLNLQKGGNTLVWFGLTWSLELYQQTVARLYRQGQTKDTVVIQHIVTKGTIDENILKALENKDKTQASLIDAVKANLKGGNNVL